MSAIKIQDTLNQIERSMTELAPYRKPALFNEFLLKGYSVITLSSVSQAQFSELLQAKLCLGTLITLYDDYADRPSQHNPQLLAMLYQMNFERRVSVGSINSRDRQVLDFARSLFLEIENILSPLPHYRQFKEILNFDLMQFYNANQFSSLLMANPYLNNPLENRLYAHHNMGMMIVAMMDLMASEKINFSEIGVIREIFLMGQRMGRIFNVLATRHREAQDGDITGELATCKTEQEIQSGVGILRQEIRELYAKIKYFDARVSTFSVSAYLKGLEQVQNLHEKMEGII